MKIKHFIDKIILRDLHYVKLPMLHDDSIFLLALTYPTFEYQRATTYLPEVFFDRDSQWGIGIFCKLPLLGVKRVIGCSIVVNKRNLIRSCPKNIKNDLRAHPWICQIKAIKMTKKKTMFCRKGSSINHVVKFLGNIDPLPHIFVVTFTGLCY